MSKTYFTLPEDKREGSPEQWVSEEVAIRYEFGTEAGYQYHDTILTWMGGEEGYYTTPLQGGGSDLWGTLNDYQSFLHMVANMGDGVFEDPRSFQSFLFDIMYDEDLTETFGMGEGLDWKHTKYGAWDETNQILHWSGVSCTIAMIDFKNEQVFTFFTQSFDEPGWETIYNAYVESVDGEVYPGRELEECVCATEWTSPGECDETQFGCPDVACDSATEARWCIIANDGCSTDLGGYTECDDSTPVFGHEEESVCTSVEDPEAIVIDVRSAAELESGFLGCSSNLDYNGGEVTEDAVSEITGEDLDALVVIYCGSGARAENVKTEMMSWGYTC